MDTKADYEILHKMGYTNKAIMKIIKKQVITFFCIPFTFGFIDCIFATVVYKTGLMQNLLGNSLVLYAPTLIAVAKFLLLFLFQGSGYKFRTSTNIILLITCAAAIIGIGISRQVYALLYGIQFLVSCPCLAFVLLYHRKRMVFVLKSERKSILFSVIFTVAAFLSICCLH